MSHRMTLPGSGVLLAALLLVGDVRGQSEGVFPMEAREAISVSYHRFVRPGEVPMNVEVMGLVRSPGVYEVGLNTDLGRMLALAGGSSEGLRSSGEDVKLRVDLYRPDASGRRLIYSTSLDSLFLESVPYPELQEGDVINVHGTVKKRFGWRDSLSIATSAAALALFIERLTRLVR